MYVRYLRACICLRVSVNACCFIFMQVCVLFVCVCARLGHLGRETEFIVALSMCIYIYVWVLTRDGCHSLQSWQERSSIFIGVFSSVFRGALIIAGMEQDVAVKVFHDQGNNESFLDELRVQDPFSFLLLCIVLFVSLPTLKCHCICPCRR